MRMTRAGSARKAGTEMTLKPLILKAAAFDMRHAIDAVDAVGMQAENARLLPLLERLADVAEAAEALCAPYDGIMPKEIARAVRYRKAHQALERLREVLK